MFCSTIIPTIGRSTLSRAVISILDQSFNTSDFEVIVVNDSGQLLPYSEWQQSEYVRVVNTNCHERSVARNTGAAIAKGDYLHFLDDDDYFLPGAMDAFWKLHQSNEAAWLYGGYQTVDNQGNLVNEFTPDLNGNIFAYLVAGEAIPFQASLLKTQNFFSVGAFDPKITGPEDRDLGRRMALSGTVTGMPVVVAKIRIGEIGSTTKWSTLAELDRWGREKALREPAAYHRLRGSANSAFLKGRVCRAYLASLVWNLKNKDLLTASSRTISASSFAVPSGVFPSFWHGLFTKIK